MPKRTDIHKILIIGSGPIVIGQACEFDYSGTQGCKALRDEGYEVVLVNSNPATIMTDPETGDRTYIEPITPAVVERIIDQERPDCLLPTLGGQTALNTTKELAESGVLDQYGVELIGAKLPAIRMAEDRQLFKDAMQRIGLVVPTSGVARSMEEALAIKHLVGLPAIIRPAYTLGGTGAGTAFSDEDYPRVCAWGLAQSPVHEILIEQSVLGWKEFELEVMRDLKDNVVIICSIENFDPMGVHTGDSITVAPAQTLTDREYQLMRDAAIAIIREIGVETGGSNIQFATNPRTGEMVVIEMNPRVSRSSALASKATGFPIAKIAAKLAVGLTLDEIPNDITKKTPASFEPTIDYTVVKIPRWAFEKFPGAEPVLGTQMKSVGETMAIGRTFQEALQKGLRGLEIDRNGLGCDRKDTYLYEQLRRRPLPDAIRRGLEQALATPSPDRVFAVRDALLAGLSVQQIHRISAIDPWFVERIEEIVELERVLRGVAPGDVGLAGLRELLWEAKSLGFSDRQIAYLWNSTEEVVRARRVEVGVRPVFKCVDTCGAEFEAETPYSYSTYERPYRIVGSDAPQTESEVRPSTRDKVMVLGGGPNRIGQGIEFDYCCVHAVMALAADGFETIMVNSNPETVSTDYDTSDRLYFEPLTFEDVMNIIEAERPMGVIVQFGGQTPLKLAGALDRELARRREAGDFDCRILGTPPDAIDLAEDRRRFACLLAELDIPQPPNGSATSVDEAVAIAERVGYPVLVRPSFVLGGRAMQIVYDAQSLRHYMAGAVEVSFDRPVLVDRFLQDAIEVDVDAVADGTAVYIGGIMEHIEYAGVHSGDSACVLPARSLSPEVLATIARHTEALALGIGVRGLMNVQYAVARDGTVYVLEVNPRASRTVPFVSKATGVPLAKVAASVMAGKTLADFGLVGGARPRHVSVKEAVLPFVKFPHVDTLLGPEMRSTGEVMGIDDEFGLAFAKSQLAAGNALPVAGYGGNAKVFVSVDDHNKQPILPVAKALLDLGYRIIATVGTQAFLTANGIPAVPVFKVNEGRPNIVDLMLRGNVSFVINTPLGQPSDYDEKAIRRCALERGIPYVTTVAAAAAMVEALESARAHPVIRVKTLQDYHAV